MNRVYDTKYYCIHYDIYKTRLECVKYNRLSGIEIEKNRDYLKGFDTITDDKEIERISLSRTKRNINELAMCNSFTHFITITLNSAKVDRYSFEDATILLRKKLAYIRAYKSKDFRYLIIYEKHKDGAFHFHGLVKGIDELLTINNNGFLHCPYIYNTVGFNSLVKINLEDNNSYAKVCSYITKYITKENQREYKGCKLYYNSIGLKKADRYEVKLDNDIDWDFENDFVKIKDLDNCNDKDFNTICYLSEKKKLDFFKN